MTKQTKKQKPSFDVADIAVVGGGLTGFAMALSAAHHGVTVSLIDRAPKGQKGDETAPPPSIRKVISIFQTLG